MEHYEVSDLFGRRRRPLVHVIFDFLEVALEKVGDPPSLTYKIIVRIFAQNVGKALAKYVRTTIQFENADIGPISRGHFERIDYLRDGVPTLQYDNTQGVMHPAPVRTQIGELVLRLKNAESSLGIDCDVVAEDMEFRKFKDSLTSKDLDYIADQLRLKKGSSLSTETMTRVL